MYSFHGAKPPALHLINFLLFMWLKLYGSFSLGDALPSLEDCRLLELLVNHHFNDDFKLSHFARLSFLGFFLLLPSRAERWHERGKKQNKRNE